MNPLNIFKTKAMEEAFKQGKAEGRKELIEELEEDNISKDINDCLIIEGDVWNMKKQRK